MAQTKKEKAKIARKKYATDTKYREYKKEYRKKYEKEHEKHEELMSREYYRNHPKYRKEKIAEEKRRYRAKKSKR